LSSPAKLSFQSLILCVQSLYLLIVLLNCIVLILNLLSLSSEPPVSAGVHRLHCERGLDTLSWQEVALSRESELLQLESELFVVLAKFLNLHLLCSEVFVIIAVLKIERRLLDENVGYRLPHRKQVFGTVLELASIPFQRLQLHINILSLPVLGLDKFLIILFLFLERTNQGFSSLSLLGVGITLTVSRLLL